MSNLYVGNKWGQIGKPDASRPIIDSDLVQLAVSATALNMFANGAGITAGINAVVPTADGTGTGVIPAGGLINVCTVTPTNAAHWAVLPAPVPGSIVVLINAAANTAYELRSSAPATVGIGEGTGAAAESAIPAKSVAVLMCQSATNWVGFTITAATLAAVEAAA